MKAIKDFNQVLQKIKASSQMIIYIMQEKILQNLVQQYPAHNNPIAVELKVKLLNLFYSTNVWATTQMAEHICKIKDIDDRFKRGDQTLVGEIANLQIQGRNFNFYSFATKYCALHQPTKFPIYDSVVSDVFKKLLVKGCLVPDYRYCKKNTANTSKTYSCMSFEKDILKDYVKYCALYQYFMEGVGLKQMNMRDVDRYIWGAQKLGIESDLSKLL